MGPSMAVRGGTTSGVFETPMEKVLAPALRPGQIVVMDKLGAHRPGRVRELIEERGCELCCTCAFLLPGPQPDRRSLRQFAKVKHILREIAARAKGALIEAMGRALEVVSTEDVRGFFVHCGYRPPAQQL